METSEAPSTARPHKPVAAIVIGMAGSGKSTLMQRLNAHLHTKKTPSYLMNLDPAALNIPFGANIDIRDTVKYKEVMKQYKLGPNGAIMTSLNLFATRFDQVLGFAEKRSDELEYILVDTPGQIEVFTWSASGAIITDSLAFAFPTVMVYVVDTPRSTNPTTFMSNMLYACSILYKTKLPLIVVFNKTDIQPHEFAIEWMTDYESFRSAVMTDDSFMGSLTNSMSLVLDEFYQNLKAVGVSAVTGAGIDDFFTALDEAGEEYYKNYRSELDKKLKQKADAEESRQRAQFDAMAKDLKETQGRPVVLDAKSKLGRDETDRYQDVGVRDIGYVPRGRFEFDLDDDDEEDLEDEGEDGRRDYPGEDDDEEEEDGEGEEDMDDEERAEFQKLKMLMRSSE